MLALPILGTALFPSVGYLHRAALWGIVLLASFAGWGALLASVAFPDEPVDIGLRLAWGLAAVIAIGGTLCMLSFATHASLFGVVLIGVAAQTHAWFPRAATAGDATSPMRHIRGGTAVVLGIVLMLAAIQYYAGAAGARLTPDDTIAYLAFPRKILATGTLLEPFSIRRLSAYGGQSLLHALTLIGCGNVLQVALLDIGICLVVLLALVIAGAGTGAVPTALWVPALVLVTLPNLHANSTSLLSGLALFVGLFRTASAPMLRRHPKRCAAVLGALAGSAASLRLPYGPPAVVFLVVLYAPLLIISARRRRADLTVAAIAAAAMALVLLPWAVLSYRSNGTLLFPLFDGYYHPEYGRMTAAPLADHIRFLALNLRELLAAPGLPLFIASAFLVPWSRTQGALTALACASVLGFLAIVWGFPTSDTFNLRRYQFAFVYATVLGVVMYASALRWMGWSQLRFRDRVVAVLVLTAIVWHLLGHMSAIYGGTLEYARLIAGAARQPSSLHERDTQYRSLQNVIPAGAGLFAMVDEPFRLDFGRNSIAIIDLPALVSPPPGLPIDDDEAFASYLIAQGYPYVALIRPSASWLYQRGPWEHLLGPSAPPLWRHSAPAVLKVFDRFEGLMKSRSRLYDDGKMVALDLSRRVD